MAFISNWLEFFFPVSHLGCAKKGIPLINIHYLHNIWMSRLFGLTFIFALFSDKVYSGPLLLLDF